MEASSPDRQHSSHAKKRLSLLCKASPTDEAEHLWGRQGRKKWQGTCTGAAHRDHLGQIVQLGLVSLLPQGFPTLVVWGLSGQRNCLVMMLGEL